MGRTADQRLTSKKNFCAAGLDAEQITDEDLGKILDAARDLAATDKMPLRTAIAKIISQEP